MEFTEKEAKAKKGKRVRVCDDSLSSYGIAKGTIGKVVDAKSEGNVDVIIGRVSMTGGKGEEVWLVWVEFGVLGKQSNLIPFNKEAYESSLEEEPA